MSRLLSTIVLMAVVLTSGVYGDGEDCTVITDPTTNETATLSYLAGNVSITGGQGLSSVSFAPCGNGTQTFPNCGDLSGYVATYKVDGSCDIVYAKKNETTYDFLTKEFVTRYYNDNGEHQSIRSIFGAQAELYVLVHCAVGADPADATILSNGTILVNTETVCAGYTPQTPEPEKEGLSTGAIVGIVIGALAILVIVLVIFRWKAQKGEDEGEYQRV